MPAVKRNGPANSFDVAALAGVSRATVSHILNGRGIERFPQETRDRVIAAAAELDYRPSPAGRSLVKGRSDTIVVLAANTTWGPNLQDAVDRITADTASLGANVVIRFAGPDPQATIDAVLDLRPLAVVDLGFFRDADRRALESHNVITVPGRQHPTSETSHVDVDRLIVTMQVDALLRTKPRRLVFAGIADERQDPYGPRRDELLRALCSERELQPPIMVRVPLELGQAQVALSELLTGDPVGFACYNDDVALAVLACARQAGLDVPGQVAAVGVDATEVGQLWSPRLTSIDVDIRALMDAAVAELRALIGAPVAIAVPVVPRDLVRLLDGESA